MPIVTDKTPFEGQTILVGESAMTRKLGFKSEDFDEQEYMIRFLPETLVLMGKDWEDTEENQQELGISTTFNSIGESRVKLDYAKVTGFSEIETETITLPGFFDPQGTCYAVYDFLERFCNVRWYAPTELGMVYPETDALAIKPENIRRSPAFAHREGWVTSPWPILKEQWDNPTPDECQLYVRRLRVGGDKWAGNHSFRSYYDRFLRKNPDNPELFEGEHPEYFAQGRSQGERQFCYTNQAFIEQVAQDARDFFDGKSLHGFAPAMGDYFAVVPMDNNAWCLCPNCQAELEKDKQKSSPYFSNGRASGYMFGFINKVAKELAKTHPDKSISALAYWDYAHYPEGVELEPNLAVAPCLHTRLYWGPKMEKNDVELYKSWIEKKDRPIYLWLYNCFPEENALVGKFHCFPGFSIHIADRFIKMFHKDGVRGFFLCGIGEQVDYYVTVKLFDNIDLNVDDVLDEFFSLYYGSASEPVKKLYLRIEEIYSSPESYPESVIKPDGHFHQTEEIAWKYLGTEERMAELGQILDEAKSLAKTDIEQKRVRLFEKGVWEYMLEGRQKYLEKSSHK